MRRPSRTRNRRSGGMGVRRKRRPRRKRHGPKRPLVAYMFFCKSNRDKVIKNHPNASFGQIGRLLGQNWRNLSDAEKKPYEKRAAVDRQRWKRMKSKHIRRTR